MDRMGDERVPGLACHCRLKLYGAGFSEIFPAADVFVTGCFQAARYGNNPSVRLAKR
jgi:hypothetical protein